MRTTIVKLYSLEYNQLRTYWAVTLFVAGNMILPAVCVTWFRRVVFAGYRFISLPSWGLINTVGRWVY